MKRKLYIPIDIGLDFTVECPALVKRGDTLDFTFNIYNKGALKDLTGQTVTLNIEKPDGKIVEAKANVSTSTVTASIGVQGSVLAGIVQGDFKITDTDGSISSNTFTFTVQDSVSSDILEKSQDVIASLDEVRELVLKWNEQVELIGVNADAVEALNGIKNYINNTLPTLQNETAWAKANLNTLDTKNSTASTNITNLINQIATADDLLDKFRLYDPTNLIQQVENNTAQLSKNAQEIETVKTDYAKKTDVNTLASDKADKTALEATNSNVNQNSTDIATQKVRIDNFTKLAEGSTTGDAELIDARVGADGVTYANVGAAVRTQITNVANDIVDISGLKKIPMISGYNVNLGVSIGSTVDLTPGAISGWNYAIVNCTSGDKFTVSGKGGVNPRLWGFVDSNNNLLSRSTISITATNEIITAPSGANKLIINSSVDAISYIGKANSISVSESIFDISYGYGKNLVEYAVGGDIKTGFSIGDVIDINGEDVANYKHLIIACNNGDTFKIYGTGGINPRLWAFIDKDNKLLSVQTENIGYKTNAIIIAPKDATQLIVNFNVSGDNPSELYLYNADNIKNISDKLEDNIENITNEVDDLKIKDLVEKYYKKGNITTNVSIGEYVSYSPSEVSNYKCVIRPCSPGDKFIIHGTGGTNPKLWAFAKNNALVSAQDSQYAYKEQYIIITVPQSADTLIANFYVSNDNSSAELYKYEERKNNINEMSSSIPDDIMSSFINGIKFAEELKTPITDLKKNGDLMVHVSTFCIIDDIIYATYYVNTRSNAENPTQHTARFVYCSLNYLDNKTFIDLQDIGETFNGKTVTALYDTILLRKNDDVLYLMWTAELDGVYYRLFRTYTISTNTLSDIAVNKFTVGDVTNDFSTNGIISALGDNDIVYKALEGDIGIMQKLSSRVENGVMYYYTGAYVGAFNCIIKSSDLINWIFVAQPDFYNESQWENAVYVLNNKVYYFCRQYSNNNTGFLTLYNLNTKQWETPIFLNDCQSRSDFFEYNEKLYMVHAPKDRNHLSIMEINKDYLNKSVEVQTAKVPDYFYPFVQIYKNELYISFTQTRQHIWVSKFTINTITSDAIINKFSELFIN